jgi:ketosteroid isomerase-like protein
MKILMHVALLLAFTAPADMPPGLEDMVAAERAFARRCAEVGVNASFRDFLLPNAIVFVPHPSEAGKVFEGPGNPSTLLDWDPQYGDISSSADLGYLTGPYAASSKSGDRAPRTGTYFSIWERQADGAWKVALDAGVEGPNEAAIHATVLRPARTAVPRRPPAQGTQPSEAAEKAFASDAVFGYPYALSRHGDPALRVHRKDRAPITGLTKAIQVLPKDERTGLATIYSKASGDLAYAYGRYKVKPERTESESGYYVHVWRQDARGSWKLVYDGWHPLPPTPRP